MKVFLTGGAGDLGQMVSASLSGMGHVSLVFDVRQQETLKGTSSVTPSAPEAVTMEFIEGSILDREKLKAAMRNTDIVVHIAAWHDIQQTRQEKTANEYWDLNVSGTFNVFQAAYENEIKSVVFVSSTSIDDEPYSIDGQTKMRAEEIARDYAVRHGVHVITLRPRAFIPPWNRAVYANFIEWAKWFSKGAVHISDVSQAVIKSIELLSEGKNSWQDGPLFLPVDGAYQYTDDDLANWDSDGPGSTFKRHYKQFYDLAQGMGLDPSLKPSKLDISETERILHYKPLYSMKTLLLELKMYGADGPYKFKTVS